MPLTINFELSDQDLDHFRDLMHKAIASAESEAPSTIIAGTEKLLEKLRGVALPEFIRTRMESLEMMKTMLEDHGFDLPDEERQRVVSALTYFLDPNDMIADDIPVLGFLDDAIMIELINEELQEELHAYRDFCQFRETESNRRGTEISLMTREEWMDSKRIELIDRIRERRADRSRRGRRSLFGGY